MKSLFHVLILFTFVLLATGCNFFLPPMAYNNPNDPNLDNDAEFPIPRATIQVDGDSSDWDPIILTTPDPSGDSESSAQGTDILSVSIAQDDEYVYCLAVLTDAPVGTNSYHLHLNILNPDTGTEYGSYDSSVSFSTSWELALSESIWDVSTTPIPIDPGFTAVTDIIELQIPKASIDTERIGGMSFDTNDSIIDADRAQYLKITF